MRKEGDVEGMSTSTWKDEKDFPEITEEQILAAMEVNKGFGDLYDETKKRTSVFGVNRFQKILKKLIGT